ncbi:MAG TPA: ATP-binding cassette domain-containing protein [Ignavibacteriaceae bacterium]|nr:ATP-binding cassette domain-containing protein [Ignavibacteriaceae bacterium]
MLVVKHLTKKYKNVVAVNDLSFTVNEGKIFGLLGPNGAGKTTTIRTVLNIIKPTSGEISFFNRSISSDFFNQIGYLPEERGLYKKSRVNEVILYFAVLKNMPRSEAQKQSNYWLSKLELEKYRNNRIEELSRGNQQKVQFITSVIHNPRLLILDEPFSGFDPINQQIIRETILSFVNEGKLIILSTHLMDMAEKMCSDILLLNSGKEVCSGPLSQLKKNFGGNVVELGFEGNNELIKNLSYVKAIDNYNNYAEVQLADSIEPYIFLRDIAGKIKINHFRIIEPTLNKIFIDMIKQST